MPHGCVMCGRQPKTRSMFSAPKDPERLAQWQAVLPRTNVVLSPARHWLCEVHFLEEDIVRKLIMKNSDGVTVCEAAYSHPRLRAGAVPQLWPESSHKKLQSKKRPSSGAEDGEKKKKLHSQDRNESSAPGSSRDHSYVKAPEGNSSTPVYAIVEDESLSSNASVSHASPLPAHAPVDLPFKYEVEVIEDEYNALALPLTDRAYTADEIRDAVSVVEDVTDVPPDSANNEEVVVGRVSPLFIQLYKNAEAVKLPFSWNRIVPVKGPRSVFYAQFVTKGDASYPGLTFYKKLLVTEMGNITCSVLGMPLDTEKLGIPCDTLQSYKQLDTLIYQLDKVSVCEGNLLPGELEDIDSAISFTDSLGNRRHKMCALIVDGSKRCEPCKRLRKTLVQRKGRQKKNVDPKHIFLDLTPRQKALVDMLRKRHKATMESKHRAEAQVEKLKEELRAQNSSS